MVNVSNDWIISMNRGDSVEAALPIMLCGNASPIEGPILETDEFFVGITEPHQPFEHAIVKKKSLGSDVVDGNLVLRLEPRDTELLLPGLYYYEVKMRRVSDGETEEVLTVIPKKRIFILE